MLDHYTKDDTVTYSARDWSAIDLGCARIDCIKWGHRDVTFDKKEVRAWICLVCEDLC
jgi:hypothetical protein